jgi:hypothetical protein
MQFSYISECFLRFVFFDCINSTYNLLPVPFDLERNNKKHYYYY